MPMSKEDHESLLNELNNPELEHSRRADILTSLRGDYGTVLEDHAKSQSSIEKLNQENADLTLANSKLFRQIGEPAKPPKQEQEKTFSQTVTLKDLESNALNQ